MFQKILPRTGYFQGKSAAPAALPPLNKLKQQRQYGIDQGRRKDPLGRAILVRIDIKRKKRNVQHQAGHRNRGDLRLVRPQEKEEIIDAESGIEFDEIVDDKADDRRYQSQQ